MKPWPKPWQNYIYEHFGQQNFIPEGVEILDWRDNGHTLAILRSDGIIHFLCADDVTYDVPELAMNKMVSDEWTQLQPKAKLFYSGKYVTITAEGRKVMASDETSSRSLAEAYVIRDLPQNLIADFYLRMDKPIAPTKFFRTLDEAENWISDFVQQ